MAALALGTESVTAVDVIAGPGNAYVQEAKRRLSDVVGMDSFAGPSELAVVFDETADVRLVAADLLAQAEHGPASLVVAVSPSAEGLDALADPLANAQARAVLVDAPDLEAALAFVEDLAPEHLQLMGEKAEGLAPRVRRAGCLFVGAASGDGVRGLRGGLQPRAPHRRRGPVRVGAVPPHLPAHDGRGARRLRRRSWRGRERRSRAPRGSSPTPSRWRRASGTMAAMAEAERTAEVTRRTKETGVELTLRLDGTGEGARNTGVGFLDHMLSSSHGTGGRPRRSVPGDLETGSTTRSKTSASARPGGRQALGDQSGIPRYGDANVPMDERSPRHDRPLGPTLSRSSPTSRPTTIAASTPS